MIDILSPIWLIGYMILQGLNHAGAGRDYWGLIDPTKSGDDTKRRALFSAVSVGLLSIYLWSIWAVVLFPLFWAFQVWANDVPLCALHGRGKDHVDAMNDGNQFIGNIVRKIWPDKKLDVTSKMQVKLRSTLYEAISNFPLAFIFAGSAIIVQNYYGILALIAFPLPALSYIIMGFFGEKKGAQRAEFFTGCSVAYIVYIAKTFNLVWHF